MNEDKVREAAREVIEQIQIARQWVDERYWPALYEKMDALRSLVEPEQPEIPDGVPVIISYDHPDACDDNEFYNHEFMKHFGSDVKITIDYQRKGHVIPWHGGSMELFAGNLTDNMFVFTRGGTNGVLNKEVKGFSWEWANDAEQSKYDIIAYCIWPDYLTKGDCNE